jgi:hypothetical protein
LLEGNFKKMKEEVLGRYTHRSGQSRD